ncbi:MAG: hypothetical protein NWE83_03025 [Candidatus Bathyarchaeota archaeon]|nr:hypothetical protein [Candidatus Bathyarchaeota archaeon]
MKRLRRTQSQLQNIDEEAQEWLQNKKGKAPSTFTHCRTSIIYFQEYLQSKHDARARCVSVNRVVIRVPDQSKNQI